jgi:hypothetical protein
MNDIGTLVSFNILAIAGLPKQSVASMFWTQGDCSSESLVADHKSALLHDSNDHSFIIHSCETSNFMYAVNPNYSVCTKSSETTKTVRSPMRVMLLTRRKKWSP